MGLSRLEIRQYLERCGAYPLDDWVPYAPDKLGRPMRCRASSLGHVRYVEPDDDVHYTFLGLVLVDRGTTITEGNPMLAADDIGAGPQCASTAPPPSPAVSCSPQPRPTPVDKISACKAGGRWRIRADERSG